MKNIFILIITVLFLPACKNKQIVKDLENIRKQPIIFPPAMVYCKGDTSNIDVDIESVNAKIVIWYDSTDCKECNIAKLPDYSIIDDYCRNASYNLNLVFIFSIRKKNEKLVQYVQYSKQYFPIFIDTSNLFYKLNPHIPANKLMHSFLLDDENNVVLVGNPIQNQAMFDLYKKKIEEMVN